MARSNKFALVAGLLWAAAMLPAHAAGPAVAWPPGWTVRQAPLPQSAPEGAQPQSSETAMRLGPNGAPVAAITIMTMEIQPGDPVQLTEQAKSMLGTVEDGYTAQGLKASCGPLSNTTLGSLPALQSTCQAGKDEQAAPAVQQVVVLTVGAHEVYGVTYAAAPQNFQTYEADFRKVSASLRLQ